MRVLQHHPAAIGPADMTDHDPALDRIALDELRDLGAEARIGVVERAAPLVFIERDAPAIAMGRRMAAAPHQPGEAEADIGRDIGTHAEEFAHAPTLSKPRCLTS